jgi:endonuclease/exonuclease/phosphatase family metal-dependent hydrolase
MLIDGNDQRGIDVGLYSKLEVGRVRTNIFDGPSRSRTFSRDCLEVEVKTVEGRRIFLLINHLKSKWGRDQVGSDQRRERQARRVAQILDERYDLENELVVVAGDLNDRPDRQPVRPLLQKPHLHDVLKLEYPIDPDKRWTYHYEHNEQIDYILVSDKLKDSFREAGVWRRGIAKVDEYSNGETLPYDTVTTWRNAASDHGAVWATFDI